MTAERFLAHLLTHDAFAAMRVLSVSQKPLSVKFERDNDQIVVVLKRANGIEGYEVTLMRGSDTKSQFVYGFTDIDAFLNDLESYVTVMNTNSLTQ